MWDENFDERKHWDDYVSVNQAFAQAVADNYEPGDLGKYTTSTSPCTHTHAHQPTHLIFHIVWIQDYHLLLVPQMLRQLKPDALIGLFLHIPFPSSEIFRCLPRKWTNRKERVFSANMD